MRIEAKTAVLSLLLGGLLSTAVAQRIITDRPSPKTAPPKTHPRPLAKPGADAGPPPFSSKSAAKKTARRPDLLADRLLSPDEGLAVIAAALAAHIRRASGDDCSQLVHAIYERAGFAYPYSNSWDLYDGAPLFHRIWKPQPGDLVVWQGHVGIVVSPKEHLFFSKLTSSGQDVASYDAPYWRERGHARFFRYLKPAAGTVERAAALRRRRQPPALQVAEARPDRSPRTGGFDGASPDSVEPDSAPAESPESPAAAPLLQARRPRPEQVRQAILRTLLQAAPALEDSPAPALSQPLIVFDDLRVERVRLDGDKGWAEVRIHQVGSIAGGRADLGKRVQRAFWSLRRRDRESWEVVTPQETIYLPREAAVPVLTHQLAVLPDRHGDAEPGAPQKKSLARLLNVLLEP